MNTIWHFTYHIIQGTLVDAQTPSQCHNWLHYGSSFLQVQPLPYWLHYGSSFLQVQPLPELVTLWVILQVQPLPELVTLWVILPPSPTTAIIGYTMVFFVGAQTAVGLKRCGQLQLRWAVFLLVTTHIAYASTKNTQIIQIKQEFMCYTWGGHIQCLPACFNTILLPHT